MDIIFDIILPVFGIVLIGYVAARSGAFPESAGKGLAFFVFNFAIPPLLFRSMAVQTLPDPIEWSFLASYFGGSLIVCTIGGLLTKALFRRDFATSVVCGATSGVANIMLLGLPLVLTTFGEVATFPIFLLLAFNAPIMVIATTLLIEGRQGGGANLRQLPVNLGKSLVTNPIVMALILGVMWNLAGWELPYAVDVLTKSLGQAALPGAVFSMGVSLAAYRVAGAVAQVGLASTLKLIAHPFMVWVLATFIFSVEPLWRDIAVLAAAAPAGVNVYMVATRYDAGTSHSAAAMLVSSLFAVVSVSVILHLLGTR
ncbi:MAG: AEC family transporter [Alphaproteobacteria bacterium]|nr:AEC family transporter [Alphaproteobacteria bacterium]